MQYPQKNCAMQKKMAYKNRPNFFSKVFKSGVHWIHRTTFGMQKIAKKATQSFWGGPKLYPFFEKLHFLVKTIQKVNSWKYYLQKKQGWASVLFKRTFWSFFAFFSVLYIRTFRSLRSFAFFIKERSDLCVLFRSL